jgi:hypothetical protein
LAHKRSSSEAVSPGFQVETWFIDRPIDYPKNARKWSKQAIEKVARSIKEFGWRQPIVVDSEGVIVIGHLRRVAGKSIGLTECPVHVARDLSPAKIRALRLADNRTAQEADWDLDILASEFADLKTMDFDLTITGFDSRELDKLLLSPNAAEDDIPPVPEAPVSRLGDLWVMGGHRLLCGDSRDAKAVAQLMDGNLVNLVFTSPPYAEQRDYDKSSGFRPIPPDEYVEWFSSIAQNIRESMALDGSYFLNIKPSVHGLDTELYVLDLVLAHARQWGFHFATEFCWERNGVPKSVTQRFKNQFEPVYQFVLDRWKMRPDAVRHFSENVPMAGGVGSGSTSWAHHQGGFGDATVSGSFGSAKKRRNRAGTNQGSGGSELPHRRANGTSQAISDVQGTAHDAGEYIAPGLAYPGNRLPTFAGTHQATGHAAAFPVGLPDFFVRAYTDQGDHVYDPFAGSGSTIIAAHNNARRGYGMELSPAYCDIVVIRWQNLTGKEATLADGDHKGATFEHVKFGRRLESQDAIKDDACRLREEANA